MTIAERKQRLKEYRRAYYLKNKERANAYGRDRYHTVYKNDASEMKRRREKWREYAKYKGRAWTKERSEKYRKRYADLSEARKQYQRDAYKKWSKKNENWSKRVRYARTYRRRRDPMLGLSAVIRAARKSGDFTRLNKVCLDAIVSIDANESKEV